MFEGKNILVIGGTGTIGKQIVKFLLNENPKVIRVFSRDEFKQFEMAEEFKTHKNLRFLIGDVRDLERLKRATFEIDIIFHLAAMKHVPSCEYNPSEAIRTNVLGTENVIEASLYNNVERVVFSSTDKTINPTNTYGATKLLAERLISAANYSKGNVRTIFSAVRFGNVMGSRGSVIPLFVKQLKTNKKITITEPQMSRFMMTKQQAAKLLIEASLIAKGGEIFVLKMPVLKLDDLSDVIIEAFCTENHVSLEEVSKTLIGLRPGEKMYEELMTEQESKFATEIENMFIIESNILNNVEVKNVARSYQSNLVDSISKEEIYNMLKANNLI